MGRGYFVEVDDRVQQVGGAYPLVERLPLGLPPVRKNGVSDQTCEPILELSKTQADVLDYVVHDSSGILYSIYHPGHLPAANFSLRCPTEML